MKKNTYKVISIILGLLVFTWAGLYGDDTESGQPGSLAIIGTDRSRKVKCLFSGASGNKYIRPGLCLNRCHFREKRGVCNLVIGRGDIAALDERVVVYFVIEEMNAVSGFLRDCSIFDSHE